MKMLRLMVLALLIPVSLCGTALASGSAPRLSLSRGQTVYASVYSNVFGGPKATPVELETILSIRNTDMANSLTVTVIDYYDTEGRFLRRHLSAPVTLGPLATTYIHVRESESTGGPGSNFIVRWKGAKPMNPPIIETVMLSTRGGQGISFVTPGQVIREE